MNGVLSQNCLDCGHSAVPNIRHNFPLLLFPTFALFSLIFFAIDLFTNQLNHTMFNQAADYDQARKEVAYAGLVYLLAALIFNLIGYFASPYVIIAFPFIAIPIMVRVYFVNEKYNFATLQFMLRVLFFEFFAEAMVISTFLYYSISLRDISSNLNSVATLYTSAFPQKFIVMFWFGFSCAYVTCILLLGIPCLAPDHQLKPSESRQKLNDLA